MAEICEKCGANLALVGRSHNCQTRRLEQIHPNQLLSPVAPSEQLTVEVPAVNAVNKGTPREVNKKRGAYPDTGRRRDYMREYMRKKRTFGKGKGP